MCVVVVLCLWNGHLSRFQETRIDKEGRTGIAFVYGQNMTTTHSDSVDRHPLKAAKSRVQMRRHLQESPSEPSAPMSQPVETPLPSIEPPSAINATAPTTANATAQDSVDWEYENIVALRWKIENPPQVTYDGLMFNLLFTVSDYIQAQSHVRCVLYESETCGGNEEDLLPEGSDYISTEVKEDEKTPGGGLSSRVVTITSTLNPQTIRESKAYQEQDDQNAAITFCVRFSLWSGPPSDDEATLVNHVDATVSLTLVFTDEFSIKGQKLEAKETEVKTTDDAFFVEAFLCNELGERIQDLLPYVQGQPMRICVKPTQQALDAGFRMRNIDRFTFEQGYTTQEAVINKEAASNRLTELWCLPGVVQCMFETLLFAYFFQSDTSNVKGYGVASLQWISETAEPTFRHLLSNENIEIDHHQRHLQGAGKTISIPDFSVQRADDLILQRYSSGHHVHGQSTVPTLSMILSAIWMGVLVAS